MADVIAQWPGFVQPQSMRRVDLTASLACDRGLLARLRVV